MKRGFGIVEMLVVLAVLGIALGLGFPSLQSYITRSQLNQSAEELATLIKRVGGQALNNSEVHYLNIPTGDTLSWGVGSSGSGDQTFKLGYGALASCTDASGTPCPAWLSFSGRGLPASQYNLTLSHKGRSQRVVVLLTGKVVIPR
jgi:prepilin-type N-terminal cleavage/methylation domain-containing protein